MADSGLLQDIPSFPIAATGAPFGSAAYQAEILPFLESQLQAQAQRAANARGMFFSGPSTADEQEAAAMLAYNMAQQGAQQSENEKILSENQAFQQQLQKEQEQAQQQLAQQQGASALKSAAIGGIGNSAGTLGALYMMGKLGGGATPVGAVNPTSAYNASLAADVTPSSAADAAGLPWYQANVPGADAIPGSAGEAGMFGASYSPMALGAGGLAGLLGYNIGGDRSGLGSELGGGLGGALGFMAGGPLGAGLGAFGGKYVGNALANSGLFSHLF